MSKMMMMVLTMMVVSSVEAAPPARGRAEPRPEPRRVEPLPGARAGQMGLTKPEQVTNKLNEIADQARSWDSGKEEFATLANRALQSENPVEVIESAMKERGRTLEEFMNCK